MGRCSTKELVLIENDIYTPINAIISRPVPSGNQEYFAMIVLSVRPCSYHLDQTARRQTFLRTRLRASYMLCQFVKVRRHAGTG